MKAKAMKTSEFLTTAKGFIEQGWTQGTFARDVNGEALNIRYMHTSHACSWCAIGAIHRARYEYDPKFIKDDVDLSHEAAMEYLMEAINSPESNDIMFTISNWNDNAGQTKAGVIDTFDRAIVLAKETEEFE